MFPGPLDRRRPRSNIDTAWMQVKRAADIEGTLRLHDLRHTYASRALMQGETLQMAGKLLGRRRTATTERYAHLEDSFLIAAGELKHGPIALIEPGRPVVAFAPHDALFEKTLSNLHEVAARRGRVALVTDAAGAAAAGEVAWRTIVMPTVDRLAAPIVHAVAAQFIAYHAALATGKDVDQPRNLAKSVTVE